MSGRAEYRYRITEADNLAFWKLQFAASLKRFVLGMSGAIILLALFALYLDGYAMAAAVLIGGAVGILLFPFLIRFLVLPYQARKSNRDYALIKEEMCLSYDQSGFSIVQPSASVSQPWESIVKWHEDDAVFAAFPARTIAYVLPKAALGHDVFSDIKANLIQSGLPNKGSLRK